MDKDTVVKEKLVSKKTIAELGVEKGVVVKKQDKTNVYVSKKDYEIIAHEIKSEDGQKVKIDTALYEVEPGKVLTIQHD